MLSFSMLFAISFLITMLMGLSFLILLDRSRRLRRVRLVRYSSGHPDQIANVISQRLAVRQVAGDSLVKSSRFGYFALLLQARIEKAGLKLGLIQALLIIMTLALVVFGLVNILASFPLPLKAIISCISGYLVFSLYLSILQNRRIRTFTEALPDSIDIFARGLRSGQPVPSALQVVADRSSGIAQDQFQLCCEEMKIGVTLVEALQGIARRVGSPEASFIATATSLQAETGGNLIETLENLSALLRERRKLRKKASVLTAEMRVSAVILSSLPFVVAVTLWAMNPEYMEPLLKDPRGQKMVLASLLCLGLGIFTMYKMGQIDV